jgi:xylose dehydrogenase (NAD/NADP)
VTTALRWGLLSTAKINDAILGANVADVVAVASRDADKARAYADARKIPGAHGSYEALLADPDVDAVYISLPNGLHLPWAVKALQAGKHVLCEKPLSRRAAEVDDAFDVADAQGRLLVEGFMWRHHPQVARAQELIASGAIGELQLVRASFAFDLDRPDDPRLRRDLDGGALMDVGCYCVSAARTLTGAEPVAAHAQRIANDDDVDLVLTGLLEFPDNILATIECAFTGPSRSGVEAVGSAGTLRLTDPWHAWSPAIEITDDAGALTERITLEPANSYGLQLTDFEAAARGERAPLLGRDDAVGQARAIEALYASAESGSAGATR